MDADRQRLGSSRPAVAPRASLAAASLARDRGLTDHAAVEIPRRARRAAPHGLLLVALGAAALAALAIPTIDAPIARLLAGYEPRAEWAQGVEYLEAAIGWPVHPLFAAFTLTGAAVIASIVPSLRSLAPAALFLAGTHVFTRFAVTQIKDATGRLRPTEWLGGGAESFLREGVAFPSGHVALFASLALPLAVLAPRAAWVLAVPVFVAGARIASNSHWISDALGSVALVAAIAWIVGVAVRPRAPRPPAASPPAPAYPPTR
jgi:membrane-associated phospholipid phosphatase